MMKRSVINTNNAPAAVGPYSQAIRVGDLLFVSGQLPINPQTGEMAPVDIESQTKQVLANLQAILNSQNLTADNVAKVTIFLTKMSDFATVNALYAQMFTKDPPARECIAVAGLPKGADVEISLIAAF